MDETKDRRLRLFSGARFSSAIFCNGDYGGGQGASFAYFSGCNVDGSYLVLKRKGGVLLAHEMNFQQAREESGYPVMLMGRKNAAQLLKMAAGRGKVGFAPGEMSAARYLALRKRVGLRLADAGEKVEEVRGRKSGEEMRKLSAAAKVTRKILNTLNPWQFSTEAKLAAHLKIAALQAGGEIAFDPVVATGKNSRLPHHRYTKKKLENFVLVDFGVKMDGYCADMTRCYFRGKCKEERGAYAKCRKIHGEILKALPKCKTGKDVALLSEKLLKKYGLPPLIHSIGHGIGMDVHEYPHLGSASKDRLERAALAIEPAAYFSRFGVRYEGMVQNRKGKWTEI
ncbi:MAG: Xaa-Pro peptidase family protein [Candidatus Micrarchaeia archaeon]|jgi:Xaa-Pro aminopeptidase